MRLGGRLAAAIEVLDDIDGRHRPAADALKDWGLSHRFAGAGDRAAIGNIVYDALRRRRSAAWLLDEDTSRARAFGALLLEGGIDAEALNAGLEGDRFAPAPLSEDEIGRVGKRIPADAPDAVRADCPDWCVPLFVRAFGENWIEEAAALSERPPLDLRANTLKADRQKVLHALKGAGAEPSPIMPTGIRVPPISGNGRHPNVQVEPAFQKGWFEIQDEGSQIAADLAIANGATQVLDFCAGAGGKTLALSAAMGNHGQIFAHDAEKARLAPIFDRIRRAGCRNVQVVQPAALPPLEASMDLVLVDAPCTGSGTWRRRPDSKWRLTDRQLEQRKAEQAVILENAKRYVKPGGRLAYITCSVFREENADQVSEFLKRNPAFQPADHMDLWRTRHPDHPAAALIDPEGGIVLTPARSGTDGFFCSILQRMA
ncbi:MAG: RsmB/NOP family class I SAM-dependent RNA methyltransferase [Hyphomicrobiales bacterium]|nr:RsmB/NOP family class I SAM-dependent RNA methyltransferase [Hyphomicrobiales bacterium]